MTDTDLETGGDDVLADLEAAFDAPMEENDEILEEVEQAAEAATDETEEQPAEEQDTPEVAATDEAVEEPQQPDNEDGERILAPAHWRGDAKIRWNKLPKAVQQEIVSDYEQRAATDDRYAEIEKVLEPRRDILAAQYGSVGNAVNQLFALSDFAAKDPTGFIQYFAQQRGIQLPSAQPQEGYQDPNIQAAMQKIQQLEQQLQHVNGTIESQSTSQMQAQIDAFANNPDYPYFNDVRVQMGALIQSGAATGLEDAYEMAVHANPSTRAAIAAQKAEQDAARRAEKVAKAKAAKTMSGAPGAGGTVNDAPAATIDEELRRAAADAGW